MLTLFLKWQFLYSNANFLKAYIEVLKFALHIFSVPLLVKTFFAPWHRYWFAYPSGFNPIAVANAIFGNIMSRVIGMILRTFFILIGVMFTIVVSIFGFATFLTWALLPFWGAYFIYIGIVFLIKM